ncbi:WD repeat-containing protein 73 isoform X2 [Hyla sarda]|uniref:WD repeat-containing protein 73 isoform X2 n=1 Tax=Hyla sarda TaxID=327740 RepID=UPI0024C3464A|nr:WD repeat-containing protein 73 isoform X2 [Hyla sarda]
MTLSYRRRRGSYNGRVIRVGICIAGYTRPQNNEILQLLFPQKLHETENQGLCPERDLRVEHGGFSQHPIYSLQHIPHTSLLVTSAPSSAHVQIWQIGAEDKDVIQPTTSIQSDPSKETWTKIAILGGTAPRVVHGSQVNAVHITEIESAKRVYTLAVSSDEAIGSLSFLDPNTIHLCCLSGRQIIADVRRPGITSEGSVALSVPHGGRWCTAVKSENQDACAEIAILSSEGHITITDTRDIAAPLKCAKIKSPSAPTGDVMCVCWAPKLEGCISASGFDGTVQIYDTRPWDAAVKEVDALFTHRGHAVMGECEDGSAPRVTVHSWHPWKERTLVSAANDGSLHIWDWLDTALQS